VASRLSRLGPQLTLILLLSAVALTGALAWRAHQAALGHRATAEQTLREYAAFAAFQLKNATLNRMLSQHRMAMDPVLRWLFVNPTARPLPIDSIAALVAGQEARCECLSGVQFYYRVTFPAGSVEATPSPLATPGRFAWLRDTIVRQTQIASAERLAPRAEAIQRIPGSGAPGVPVPTQFFIPIATIIDGRSVIFAQFVSVDALGKPIAAHGFATEAGPFVGSAVARVLKSVPILPPTLTRGLPIDSILSVAVLADGQRIFSNRASLDPRFVSSDTLERRQGGFRFDVAINPAVVDRLIIGGLPRSRLPLTVGLFALAAGLLALLIHQMRRQQELIRLRTEFVSGVSHELRTPLAQILLLAELLRNNKIPTDDGRQKSLRIIDQEARRLTFLVESILNFSRLERGSVSPAPTDIGAEVEEIVTAFEPLAAAKQVRVERALQPNLVASVDRGALRQVLLNLLDNAVRYGPPGQTVSVRTGASNGTWELTVEDEGPGIPVGQRDRVFESYYRMKRDTDAATGGSGIGLAVVRGLVEQHGGTVRVQGTGKDNGARFVVALPVGGHAAGAIG
jgi:signal transduction histidine kinase